MPYAISPLLSNKWFILTLIILMYLPVSIDATILHVAIPTLTYSLNATSNEVLWIIDIYPLIMSSFLLPMGVLCDKHGVKNISLVGSVIFGISSAAGAMSDSALILIISRGFLAVGAAMILPATLATVRLTFLNNQERAIALGIWSTIGTAGAALGPLVGGVLLEYFPWQSVFLINIPICILVIGLSAGMKVRIVEKKSKKINAIDPFLLITSILIIVFSVKSIFNQRESPVLISFLFFGVFLGFLFLRKQLRSSGSMIDVNLFRNKHILAGLILALFSMISLSGFEFFIIQELQLAIGMSALNASLFLLPFIMSSCISGPFVGWALGKTGLRSIAFMGVFLSSVSFAGLSLTHISSHKLQAWGMMVLLGFSIEAAMLASTTAIMNATPAAKGGEAGAIEGMAYEFGAGIGTVIFGLMTSSFYTNNIKAYLGENDIPATQLASLSETIKYAEGLSGVDKEKLIALAKQSLLDSHFYIMFIASIFLLILSVIIFFLLKPRVYR
ncbi:MFS transporter [Klebsiella variicola]|uniref:MFS transporter n=1 Tax=Klebsiella TaxID=570 RepID=UPI003A970FE8